MCALHIVPRLLQYPSSWDPIDGPVCFSPAVPAGIGIPVTASAFALVERRQLFLEELWQRFCHATEYERQLHLDLGTEATAVADEICRRASLGEDYWDDVVMEQKARAAVREAHERLYMVQEDVRS